MTINKSRKEYNDYLYDRIKTKLIETKEYELLSFAMIGIHLMLRQVDILKLKWEQIDFENNMVKDVCKTKESAVSKRNIISDMPMSMELTEALKLWYDKTDLRNPLALALG